jgi:hypothetical protein
MLSDIALYVDTYDIDPLSTSERVEEWFFHAERFRRLLKLRKAYRDKQAINKIISINGTTFCWKEDKAPLNLQYESFMSHAWLHNQKTPLLFTNNEKELRVNNEELRQLTPIIVMHEIEPFLRSPNITLDFETPEVLFEDQEKEFEGTVHFVLKETKVTNSLLVAMYYKLFKLMQEDSNIGICDVCGGPVLIKRSRGDGPCYCSPKCKVKKHSKSEK